MGTQLGKLIGLHIPNGEREISTGRYGAGEHSDTAIDKISFPHWQGIGRAGTIAHCPAHYHAVITIRDHFRERQIMGFQDGARRRILLSGLLVNDLCAGKMECVEGA